MTETKSLDISKIFIRGIEQSDYKILQEFNCGNGSLNNFLKNEAYIAGILREASTSLVFYNKELVGYFTLKRTKLKIEGISELDEDTSLDISRLAISHELQGSGIGTYVLDEIIKTAYRINERFITLDSVHEYWTWYRKNGFEYLIEEEVDKSSPSSLVYMILDLYDEDLVEEYFEAG
jgi:ribosomal protein S18 acetylase RimI-like enzyme